MERGQGRSCDKRCSTDVLLAYPPPAHQDQRGHPAPQGAEPIEQSRACEKGGGIHIESTERKREGKARRGQLPREGEGRGRLK